MLDTFRASVDSVWTKILLGLLVMMFGVWGIGDVIRNPSSKLAVATVGDTTITIDDFSRALHRESENIAHAMGNNNSTGIIKDPAFVHYVLLQLVNKTLLKQESEALGIIPSDADVVRKIRTNPAYADKNGNFDKALFEATLRGSSEVVYVDKLRQEMASALLVDTLVINVPVPDIAARTLLAAKEEQRGITLYELKPSLITALPVADDKQLKAYYDAHPLEFTVPEYRTVSYVTISNANVSKDVKASDEELRAAYKEHLDQFKKPEQRVVEQLLYASEDKATKAGFLLKGGKRFEQVAKETDVLNKDALSLGKVERSKIIEKAADKVFSLKQGQVTAPIQSPFGWHIFHVSAIEPARVLPFEEVRPVLEKELAQDVGEQALNKLANQFQDALAGGSTLAEASHEFGLKVESVGPVDRQGNPPENTKPSALPQLDKFFDIAFKTDEKTDSSMATSKGGVYYIVHVDKVTPERVRTMEEVKGQLSAAWQKEERSKHLGELAKEIGAKFLQAAERGAIIEKYKLKPLKTATVKRDAHSAGDLPLPPALVADVFAHKPQEGSNAYMAANGDYMLAVVNSVIPAPTPESDPKMAAALKEVSRNLEANEQNEILQGYAQFLAKKYPVAINDQVLQAVLK